MKPGHDLLRELAGFALRGLRELHCDVAGEIAVRRVARAFDGADTSHYVNWAQIVRKRGQGVPHQVFDQVFQGVAAWKVRRDPSV